MDINMEKIAIEKIKRGARLQLIAGIIIVAWNSILTFSSISILVNGYEDVVTNSMMIVFFLIWILIGAYMIYIWHRKNKSIRLYNDYKLRCKGNKAAYEQDYRTLAINLKMDEDIVHKNMKLMKKYNLWEGVYGGEAEIEMKLNKDMKSEISLVCQSCGARSSININDTSAICEFCGMPLKDELEEAIRKM